MTERTKICIDRVLPRNLMRLQPTRRGPDRVVRAINPIGTTWMNGSTLRVRFMGGTAAHEFGHAIGLAHEHQSPQRDGELHGEGAQGMKLEKI